MGGEILQKTADRFHSRPFLNTASAITGQITVSTPGTAVQGPDVDLLNGVYIRALSSNATSVYVGNDGSGDVTSSNGFELSAGDSIIIQVRNLNELWFDASIGVGGSFCWIIA